MKRVLLCFLLICNYSFSQVIISNDTTVCGNFNDTLYALSAIQSSMQVDDQHDVAVPIGFTFNFYGLPYTQCVVSGNGYMTFDTTLASSYSPYSINTPIPNPGNVPENAILAPWHDINTGVSGNIYYGTTGVAPNRMFTVTWCQIAMFSCTDSIATSQVVLYEGSDKIDMFIQSKPLCAGWNGGNAVQGLVNLGSTTADIVFDPVLAVDRNYPNQWTAYDEGWEFIPSGSNYTINQIPYVPIVAGQNIWTSANGDTLGYGPTLPINISSTTTYFADVVGSCSSGMLSDDVTVIKANGKLIDVKKYYKEHNVFQFLEDTSMWGFNKLSDSDDWDGKLVTENKIIPKSESVLVCLDGSPVVNEITLTRYDFDELSIGKEYDIMLNNGVLALFTRK